MNKIEFIKSRTLRDHLNGLEPSQILMKALKLGDIKVVNGETFIVKMTPSGKLDWRKLTKKAKAKSADELFETDHFPEITDVKLVKGLGGSTGAKLVEDKDGNQYVMKNGNSKAHVEEEYLANCIYKLFDVSVPNMKLYKGKDSSTLLSDFMPNTVAANDIMDDQLRDDIANHFVLDCLLANWDIYKNDNILNNNDDGSFVRVDNGGALRFSAQGRPKGDHFTDDVDELDSMAQHNPYMASGLTDAQIKKQIKQILVKGDNILSLIEDADLKETMTNRLLDLKDYVSDEEKDPHRELREREISRAMRKAGNITATDSNGWSFLSNICKLRGFDKPPTVVTEKEFAKLLKDDPKNLMLNRGLTGSYGNPAKKFMRDFAEGEECFYGTQAMYGAGIYAAVNAKRVNPPPYNEDYNVALGYAGGDPDHVLDVIIPSDAKVIDGEELDQMMNDEFFGDEFKEKKKEYDTAKDDFNELLNERERIEDEIDFNVKEKMGWNEKAYNILLFSKPEEVYADTEKFDIQKVVTYYEAILKSVNGKLEEVDEKTWKVSLPNSSETFLLNKDIADVSIKQKFDHTTPYNWHYTRLKQYVMKNHFQTIRAAVALKIAEEKIENPKMVDINDSIKVAEQTIKTLSDDIQKLRVNGSNTTNAVIAQIIQNPGGTYRGFYAAIKGYDAIVSKRGWGSNTDFAIILNRSKMIVKEFK